MEFQADASVYASNGERAGDLDRVVIDPRTRKVTHLVIQKGLLFRSDKVVPITMVAEASKDRIVLTDDAGRPENLPDYAEDHFVQVGHDEWVEPPAAGGSAAMLPGAGPAPLLLWYPTLAGNSTGVNAPTGLGAMPAAGARARGRSVEIERSIPEDTVPLKEGARVIAADGHTVGHVDRIFTDSGSDEVTHLLISQGLFLKERKVIPMAWVLDVGEDDVRLAVGSSLLQGLRAYED